MSEGHKIKTIVRRLKAEEPKRPKLKDLVEDPDFMPPWDRHGPGEISPGEFWAKEESIKGIKLKFRSVLDAPAFYSIGRKRPKVKPMNRAMFSASGNTPGAPKAKARGCTCPRIANFDGNNMLMIDGVPCVIYAEGCPVHEGEEIIQELHIDAVREARRIAAPDSFRVAKRMQKLKEKGLEPTFKNLDEGLDAD